MKNMHPPDEDLHLLTTFVKERNLSPLTEKAYKNTLRLYYTIFQKSVTKTINTAKKEQKQNINWQETKLYQTLLQFREHCFHNYSENFAKKTFNHLKSLLRHNHVIIQELPYWNPKQNKKLQPITYEDLPTKKELQAAYKISSNLLRALITFMISTGCDQNTTLSLTIKDFIMATYEYHGEQELEKALIILENETEPVIPKWKLQRKKTNKYYTTFSSPESTINILNYIKSQNQKPTLNTQLFPIHQKTLMKELRNMNNKLGMGRVNGYSRLRTHMFRKYHASHLYHNKENEPVMTIDDIDYLQGRGKTNTRESYFFENMAHLKQKYSKIVYRVSLFDHTHIDQDSPEYQSLQKKNQELHTKLIHEKQRAHDLQLQIDDIRSDHDKLGQMILELREAQTKNMDSQE